MHTDWRCDRCGPISPLYVPGTIGADVITGVRDRLRAAATDDGTLPLWCPWPLPPGWTVTGVGWVGDNRRDYIGIADIGQGRNCLAQSGTGACQAADMDGNGIVSIIDINYLSSVIGTAACLL